MSTLSQRASVALTNVKQRSVDLYTSAKYKFASWSPEMKIAFVLVMLIIIISIVALVVGITASDGGNSNGNGNGNGTGNGTGNSNGTGNGNGNSNGNGTGNGNSNGTGNGTGNGTDTDNGTGTGTGNSNGTPEPVVCDYKQCLYGGVLDEETCECECAGGHSGDYCEQLPVVPDPDDIVEDANACAGKQCSNGGVIDPNTCLCVCEYDGRNYMANDCCDATPCYGSKNFNTCECTCYSECNNGGTRNPDCSCNCANGYTGRYCDIAPVIDDTGTEVPGIDPTDIYSRLRAGITVSLLLNDGTTMIYNPTTDGTLNVRLADGTALIFIPLTPPAPPVELPPTSSCVQKNCGAGHQDPDTCDCVCDPGFSGNACRVRDLDFNECVADTTGTLMWTGYQCITNAGGCPTDREQVCIDYNNYWYVHDPDAMNVYECTLGDERVGGTIGDSVDYAAGGRCMSGQSEAGCNQMIQFLGC